MPAPDSASPQHLAPLALRGQRIIVTRPSPDAERWVAQLRERIETRLLKYERFKHKAVLDAMV